MQSKLLIGAVALLALAGVIFLLDSSPLLAPANNEPAAVAGAISSGVVTVTYTNSGFSPRTVSIQKGQTVVFANNSSGAMWVASSPHPTHTDYPEKFKTDCAGSLFDECAGAPAGSSWSFTFNSVGSWGFHNHLKASDTGTITVTP